MNRKVCIFVQRHLVTNLWIASSRLGGGGQLRAEYCSMHCSATPSSEKFVDCRFPTVKAAVASYKQNSVHCSTTPSSDKFANCRFPTVKAAVASYEQNSVHFCAMPSEKFSNCRFPTWRRWRATSRIVYIFVQRHLVTNLWIAGSRLWRRRWPAISKKWEKCTFLCMPSSDNFVNCRFPTVNASYEQNSVHLAQRHLVTNLWIAGSRQWRRRWPATYRRWNCWQTSWRTSSGRGTSSG